MRWRDKGEKCVRLGNALLLPFRYDNMFQKIKINKSEI